MAALFQFEQDGRYALRRIPMIVRFRLDAVGIRFDFPAWAALSKDERQELVDMLCETDEEKAIYRQRLVQMLLPHADKPDTAIQHIHVESVQQWAAQAVPDVINTSLKDAGISPITDVQWQALSDLQRFALTKLTRPGHKNGNLLPALHEFKLVS